MGNMRTYGPPMGTALEAHRDPMGSMGCPWGVWVPWDCLGLCGSERCERVDCGTCSLAETSEKEAYTLLYDSHAATPMLLL